MADSAVAGLTASGALTGTELFYADSGAIDVKVTATQIKTFTGDVHGPGSATDNAIVRFDGTTGKLIQDSAVIVEDTGKLIVGGTGSLGTFDASGGNPPLQVYATGPALFGMAEFANHSVAARMYLGKSRGAFGAYTVLQANDDIAEISFQGADGTDFASAALITASVDGTPGSNDMPGRLTFSTTPDGAGSSVERMRISASGRVNIGGSLDYQAGTLELITDTTVGVHGLFMVGYGNTATAPKLVVQKTRGASGVAQTVVQDDDELFAIEAGGSGGVIYRDSSAIRFQVDGTPGVSDMPGRIVFQTVPDGSTTLTERMRIDNAGRVLIGPNTTPPSSELRLLVQESYTGNAPGSGFTSGIRSNISYNYSSGTSASMFGIEQYSAILDTYANNALQLIGVFSQPVCDSTHYVITVKGYESQTVHSGSGTVSQLVGATLVARLDGSGTADYVWDLQCGGELCSSNMAGATIGTYAAVAISPPQNFGGSLTITNVYGLWITDLKAAGLSPSGDYFNIWSEGLNSLNVFEGYVRTKGKLVTNLMSAATAGAGARSFVTDATATTFMSTVAGGGSNAVPVVSDGTNWKIG